MPESFALSGQRFDSRNNLGMVAQEVWVPGSFVYPHMTQMGAEKMKTEIPRAGNQFFHEVPPAEKE